ncbi:hypothetical protein KIPB_007618 [Kipferlia bialata]|uniref:Uncharacterized protein n=1 Tax=Kipferlia bialata TaxID=797122 RepID=A0A9K3CU50_9EUKA|nr:hypothetical protein KIPB_003883 [Kipferlia bialata]GIQ84249.1 hypothetical protein KIPB_005704 [Kipferlia bialata]GIQ85875.1 hypothetical protein KIPB_007618 [Kipferlia bialata]|eukprot:g3883.t1
MVSWPDDARTLFWEQCSAWMSVALYSMCMVVSVVRREVLTTGVLCSLLVFCGTRAFTWALHGLDWFTDLPQIAQHLVFLAPLGPLFTGFCHTASGLFALCQMLPRQRSFRAFHILSTVIIYTMIAVSLVAYALLDYRGDPDLRMVVVGWTNLSLSLVMLSLGVCITVFAWGAYSKIKRYSIDKCMGQIVSNRLVLFTSIGSIGFIGFSLALFIEGVYFIRHEAFMHWIHNEYTQTPPMEALYTVLQVAVCISAVLMRQTRNETERKRAYIRNGCKACTSVAGTGTV